MTTADPFEDDEFDLKEALADLHQSHVTLRILFNQIFDRGEDGSPVEPHEFEARLEEYEAKDDYIDLLVSAIRAHVEDQ
jgi:hypothetical protein